MSHLDKILDKTFGTDHKLSSPPRAPIISEKSVAPVDSKGFYSSAETNSKPVIDFTNMPNTYWKWCDRLETKRTWYHARFDKVHRGTVENLKRDVEERDEELDIVKLMKKQQKPLFSAVMKEFKEKLEKIKNV